MMASMAVKMIFTLGLTVSISSPSITAAIALCPTDVVDLDIAEIRAGYAAQEFTATELTTAYLERIRAYEPFLNAFITLNPDALSEAAAIDATAADPDVIQGALYGVPIVIKDNMDQVGFRTTAGYAGFAADQRVVDVALGTFNGIDLKPTQDATLVARLKQAGAIILGKTNLPDFGLDGLRAQSSVAGDSLNAYNPTFAPGASSSGTATAIAASFAVAGVGTDTAGSILFPASAQSLVGLKPSFGLVPIDGVFPGLASHHDVAGPMTQTVYDAAVMLDVIAGPTENDPRTAAAGGTISEDPSQSYTDSLQRGALQGKRIGLYEPGIWGGELHPLVSEHYEQMIEVLTSLGAEPVSIVFAGTPWLEQWNNRTSFTQVNGYLAGVDAYLQRLGGDNPASREAFQQQTGFPFGLDMNAPFFGLLSDTRINVPFGDPSLIQVIEEANELRSLYATILSEKAIDALVYPRSISPLPDLTGDSFQYLGEQIVGTEVNELGLPAITVPAGYLPDGRPIAIDIVGRDRFTEEEILAIAYDFEQASRLRQHPDLEGYAVFTCNP